MSRRPGIAADWFAKYYEEMKETNFQRLNTMTQTLHKYLKMRDI
jgi:predicted ATP-dependent Lon-type protease